MHATRSFPAAACRPLAQAPRRGAARRAAAMPAEMTGFLRPDTQTAGPE
ncbi:MAG: hypothetical protein ACE15D_03610 [Candidatus Eisenbacteria bacterium]